VTNTNLTTYWCLSNIAAIDYKIAEKYVIRQKNITYISFFSNKTTINKLTAIV